MGPYELGEGIGSGGMGSVFRAVDTRTGQAVAVKVLNAVEPAARKRLAMEAGVLSRLRHRNVVSLLEAGEEGGRPFLALELIQGRSLQERLDREGPLPPREAARVVRAVALGLAHAHREGVLHRDLKPGNVLLPADGGEPRLSDFGLAALLQQEGDRLTRTGALLGTPGFWSPEQASGRTREVGPASDVYGLGGLLYAALTGRAPIEGDSFAEVMVATINTSPRPPRIDPALDGLALRCLSKAPGDRPPSADAVARELARYLADWGGASRGPWVVAALALVVAGLSLAVVLRREPPAPVVAVPPPRPTTAQLEPPAPPTPMQPEAPSPLEALLARGKAHEGKGENREALAVYEEALRLAPDSADVWMRRGLVRFYLGDPQGALSDYDRALALDPRHHDALVQRAITLLRTGDGAGARAQIEVAVREHPKSALPYTVRGMILNETGDPKGGLASCDQAIALQPDDGFHHHTRAFSLVGLGDDQGALAAFDRTVELQPEFWSARRDRAQLRQKVDDLAGARADLDVLLEANPDDADALALRGSLRRQQGDPGGVDDLRRALELRPGAPWAEQAREMLSVR